MRKAVRFIISSSAPIAVALACALAAGCNNVPEFACDTSLSASIQGAAGPSGISADFNAIIEARWKIVAIPVCWEDVAMNTVSASDRQLVEQAVEITWNSALSDTSMVPSDQQVHFVGFGPCSSDPVASAGGVRITTTDGDPETQTIGNKLAGLQGGMELNFTFHNWSTSCSLPDPTDPTDPDQIRKHCVYAIAVHEFGHALGLVHEQNRTDTPATCPATQQQGPDGDYTIGLWDSSSVMNYCNPQWNNSGVLSDMDQAGIRTYYYPAAANAYCGKVVAPVPAGGSP